MIINYSISMSGCNNSTKSRERSCSSDKINFVSLTKEKLFNLFSPKQVDPNQITCIRHELQSNTSKWHMVCIYRADCYNATYTDWTYILNQGLNIQRGQSKIIKRCNKSSCVVMATQACGKINTRTDTSNLQQAFTSRSTKNHTAIPN